MGSKHSSSNAYPQQLQTRLLNVDFTKWTGRHLKVTEGDRENGTLVYAADLKMRKPHMIFQATGTARLPATVSFHSFTRAIDVEINGNKIPFKPRGMMKLAAPFESPALGGQTLTWKQRSGWEPYDLECTDASGAVVARFIPSTAWSMTKAGKLELQGPVSGGAAMDEVVVTGLAMAYYIMIIVASAEAGAAAGG